MIHARLLAVVVLFLSTAALAQAVAPGVVTLPGAQAIPITSKATGRNYELHIALPAGYAANKDKNYPVLYLLDGQWDFKLLVSINGGLFYDGTVPEIIIVGITYAGENPDYGALRAMDFTPTATPDVPGSGGAPKFLGFMKTELIPFIETHYRSDPSNRLLMGSSYGGLFTLYAMFNDPTWFSGYVSASPDVRYDNDYAFRQEEEFAKERRTLPGRLYLCVAGKEGLKDPVEKFMAALAKRKYAGLLMETRVIEDEGHASVKPEAYNRGLRFVLGKK
jgi:hypothetical protein